MQTFEMCNEFKSLCNIFSTSEGVSASAQRGEFQYCMISDPKSPAGQPQQINNGLMDVGLLINLVGTGKHSRTVSL